MAGATYYSPLLIPTMSPGGYRILPFFQETSRMFGHICLRSPPARDLHRYTLIDYVEGYLANWTNYSDTN
jgi:hypothetical protein